MSSRDQIPTSSKNKAFEDESRQLSALAKKQLEGEEINHQSFHLLEPPSQYAEEPKIVQETL